MLGVQWIGQGELPNPLFGLQRQWLERPLGNSSSATGPRADHHDPVYALPRDRVCRGRGPLLSVQRDRAALMRPPRPPMCSRVRRLVVRCERHAFNYLGFVHLGCSPILLRHR